MGVLSVILYTVAVIIAILLVCLVLVQPSKGGGLGTAFGGAGETVFGAQAMNHLSKLTVVLITIFFVVTLALAAVSGRKTSATATASKSSVVADVVDEKSDVKQKPAKAEVKEPAKKDSKAGK